MARHSSPAASPSSPRRCPVPAIAAALVADGIPARLSDSAGTFLCNATLYTLLHAIARRGSAIPCGFIHLPYLPRQVAAMLADRHNTPPDTGLASMDLATMERAVRIALAIAARAPA